MATAVTETAPPLGMKKLVLRSYEGITHRMVSNARPRDCTRDEIPIIDLGRMYGDLTARKAVAREILHAAETIGFFYIKNHGIAEESILAACEKTKEYFSLPLEQKERSFSNVSSYGYHGYKERHVNPSETKDRKEGFVWHYEPEFDPAHQYHLADVPQKVLDELPKDKFIWDHIDVPEFQSTVLTYYQGCLGLARRLIRLIALSLDLPENHFDAVTEYPGGDMALNYYPGHGDEAIEDPNEVGLGAHTDLQILTLLWQDEHKGLQVLNNNNEWIFAPPIPGTFVVNIGDFLMRLTNDRLKSTVHRVIQHGKVDRISMPFFFGFNFNEKLGVLPTCIDEQHPAKYEPATVGELVQKRLAMADLSVKGQKV